jgi:hypothetical protein
MALDWITLLVCSASFVYCLSLGFKTARLGFPVKVYVLCALVSVPGIVLNVIDIATADRLVSPSLGVGE